MALRITGGALKGRTLKAPRGRGVRPTTGRVREALFSILGQDQTGARVLDLCAGAGTLGVEAASRGAARVVFVEQGSDHLRVLRDNAALLRDIAEVEVKRLDARRAPGMLARAGETFDLVMCDPPYGGGLAAEILEQLAAVSDSLLGPGAAVVLETGGDVELPEVAGVLGRGAPRLYGDTRLWIYRASEPG